MVHTFIILWLIGFLISMEIYDYADSTWEDVFKLFFNWPFKVYNSIKNKLQR